MKENVFDKVVERTVNRIEMATDRIGKNFKGVKPFDKEPVTDADKLYGYNQITPDMFMDLRQSMGNDVVDDYIWEMEEIKRRMGNG